MRVEDWFPGWMARHIERYDSRLLDSAGAEFWAAHRDAMVKHGIVEAVAEEASKLMGDEKFPHQDNHRATFLDCVRRVWKAAEVPAEANSRDEAERMARGCDDCGPMHPMGLTIRFRHDAAPGEPEGFSCYCTCPMGRWVERNHREGGEPSREMRRRIVDLATRRDLQLRPVPWSDRPDNPRRYRASEWNAAAGRPLELTRERMASPSLRRMLASVGAMPPDAKAGAA